MAQRLQFTMFSRILHWTMAVLILAMLFIGIAMVSSLSDYHLLVAIHKPLGILILILVAIRLMNRLFHPPPPLPDGMPGPLRFAAHASHWLLYVLMFALPLTNSTIAESKILNVNFPSNVHGITIAVQFDSRTPPGKRHKC